jgi:hypothetical protein
MYDFPTKNRRRAYRRFMKVKMKQKARRIGKYNWGHFDEEDLKQDEHLADNLKKCSCTICQNARELEGPTLHEKRIEHSFRDQLTDALVE